LLFSWHDLLDLHGLLGGELLDWLHGGFAGRASSSLARPAMFSQALLLAWLAWAAF